MLELQNLTPILLYGAEAQGKKKQNQIFIGLSIKRE